MLPNNTKHVVLEQGRMGWNSGQQNKKIGKKITLLPNDTFCVIWEQVGLGLEVNEKKEHTLLTNDTKHVVWEQVGIVWNGVEWW